MYLAWDLGMVHGKEYLDFTVLGNICKMKADGGIAAAQE